MTMAVHYDVILMLMTVTFCMFFGCEKLACSFYEWMFGEGNSFIKV